MPALKTVGNNGQIALGKQYAGRHVLVDQIEKGVWIVKVGEFVPDSERWLQGAEAREALDEAVAWAEKTPPRETDLGRLEAQAKNRRP